MSDDPADNEVKPRWLDNNQGSNGRKAKKHENRVGKALGGQRLGRSTKHWHDWDNLKPKTSLRDKGSYQPRTTDRGDASTPKLHIEHKFTRNNSISLKMEWLEKVALGALQRRKDPCLVFTFDTLLEAPKDWALIPMTVLQQLLALEKK